MDFILVLNQLREDQILPGVQRRTYLVTYSLAQLSVIQLHNVFIDSDPNSFTLSVNAARKILGVLDELRMDELVYMDPMLGVIITISRSCSKSDIHSYPLR